jgi:hypothetical protein
MQRLGTLPTKELYDRFFAALALTAEALVEMACIVRVLEERGENLQELKLGIVVILRKIAYGQVLPELVAKYSTNPNLIRYATALPIPDQQRIVEGTTIRVMILAPDGTTDARHIEPHKLSPREIQQVFAADHIRDDGEQVSYLRSLAAPTKRARTPLEVNDKDKAIVVTGDGVKITFKQLANILRSHGYAVTAASPTVRSKAASA